MKYTIVFNRYRGGGYCGADYAMIKTDDIDKYLERYEEVVVVFEGWPMIVYPVYAE